MRDNSFITQSIIIFLLVIIFGGNLGIQINGTINAPTVSSQAPGLLGVISWCWDGISFFFAMMAFQVPNMPQFISMIFLVVFLLMLWILLKWVRGTQGT